MVQKQDIEAQLKNIGVTVKTWGVSELRELPHILMPSEQIKAYVHGWYESGFATLLATSERLLLIDKRLFNLTIEDVRYDMIAEVDFNARLMDSTIHINTLNKLLKFTSIRAKQLRQLCTYVQQRVMELRQQQAFMLHQFDQESQSHQPVAMITPAMATTSPSPTIPMQSPQMTTMRTLTPSNPYARSSLITKYQFLPKVPRRFRPTT